MIVGGIGLAQAVSDPRQVTLRWLRLGGLIALPLVAIAVVAAWMDRSETLIAWPLLLAVALPVTLQLLAVQKARRQLQRGAATLSYLATCTALTWVAWTWLTVLEQSVTFIAAPGSVLQLPAVTWAQAVLAPPLTTGLVGGVLVAMLLGHAYLTAGNEMTQRPFRRLTLVLAGLLAARAVGSLALALWPYYTHGPWPWGSPESYALMITTRYLVGLVVPGVFLYMVYDCVQRRANQSATGILYVTAVLVIMGEGAALWLIAATGYVF